MPSQTSPSPVCPGCGGPARSVADTVADPAPPHADVADLTDRLAKAPAVASRGTTALHAGEGLIMAGVGLALAHGGLTGHATVPLVGGLLLALIALAGTALVVRNETRGRAAVTAGEARAEALWQPAYHCPGCASVFCPGGEPWQGRLTPEQFRKLVWTEAGYGGELEEGARAALVPPGTLPVPEERRTMSEAAPAPVIVSDDPASFAHGVLAERHPALVARVLDTVPYGPGERAALTALLDNHLKGVVEAPEPGARDAERWTEEWGLPEHLGRSWFAAPFLWAESYFYRRFLDALGYFGSGPWRGVDPFRPFKRAELDGPGTEEELAALDALAEQPREARAAALLHGSLWGNRADLGFRLSVESGHGTGAAAGGTGDARLVADDSEALWSLLPVGTLCLVADNAGRELVPDLLLLDHLLRHGEAERAVLHVKPHPYYVSDATTADVLDAIERLHRAPGEAGAAGRRLWSALAGGRLVLRAHPFSCAPLPYADMPEDLRREFAAADLTVLKGDLNYRRLVGDRLWPPTTPFARPTAYFPGSVAALRTLKSDVITGLDPHTETGLVETEGQRWRTSGAHALIQVRP